MVIALPALLWKALENSKVKLFAIGFKKGKIILLLPLKAWTSDNIAIKKTITQSEYCKINNFEERKLIPISGTPIVSPTVRICSVFNNQYNFKL